MTAAIHRIRNTARMLMALQSRAEAVGSAYLDTEILSEHMRRDLGLMDGEDPRIERLPRISSRNAEEASTLTRLMMTPHAS
ncbi:hypothetical protein [Mesorhizobium sp. IMUNJ 23232]|uniref:hypothetical protein n=1 Tax=Mesorhizobium sp. IMUNJ 23232 TaxID=3376064 RepID=UPI0037BB3422